LVYKCDCLCFPIEWECKEIQGQRAPWQTDSWVTRTWLVFSETWQQTKRKKMKEQGQRRWNKEGHVSVEEGKKRRSGSCCSMGRSHIPGSIAPAKGISQWIHLKWSYILVVNSSKWFP
jgi:hypothetical protein